jgi:hypothetical protein
VHVGLRLRRLAPLAQRVQVALAVGAAIDDGLDVIAGPGIAWAKRAAAAAGRIAAAAEAFEHPEPHARRHRGVVGSADPFSEGAGHRQAPGESGTAASRLIELRRLCRDDLA